MVLKAVGPVLGYLFERVAELLIGKRVSLVKQLAEIAQYLLDGADVAFITIYKELVAACTDAYIEQRFEVFDVLVLNAKERVKALSGKFEFF